MEKSEKVLKPARITELSEKEEESVSSSSCCSHGPGFASALDAMKNGPREEVLYVVTVQPNLDEPHGDYLVTIDTDEKSSTYSTVIHRTFTNRTGNELHHSGWNACSSCHKVKKGTAIADIPKRDKLILPALHSNRVYVFDVGKDFRKPALYKEIDGSVMLAHNVSSPHTTHCLADGTIMISTMGDANDEAKGDFIQFDSNFNCMGTWVRGDKRAQCGYDYWYQPYFDIMVATEWSAPKLFKRGWRDEDAKNLKEVGHHLNFYRWSDHTLIQTIDLGTEGTTPLEVRFLHDPKKAIGYVGCALNANVYRFFRSNENDGEQFEVEKVIDIPTKLCRDANGKESELGGMMGDILISLDDKWLYLTNWMHGDVRQYNISGAYPRLTAQLYLGGIANRPSGTTVIDQEQRTLPNPVYMKGRRLEGAPQMLQLSLDGKRLYASSSLYSPWDKQMYPKMVEKGGHVVLIDVDNEKGGMQLNPDFFVDFGNEPYGPALPHEIRYPGGDCTSDIWLPEN